MEAYISGAAGLLTIEGLIDEHFGGFGTFSPGVKAVVLDVSRITRMTSFGVRQWLNGMELLAKSVPDIYLLGCPTFFVDQLNMVLNFGGSAQVLTVVAPFTCPSCGTESAESVDVLAERAVLAKGQLPEKPCQRCGSKLEFDDTPESYFSFVARYAASGVQPAAAALLEERGLYKTEETVAEKPPKLIKIVHGNVTYFRIIGTIGAMFRARPMLVGAEGEIVIDLAELDKFDPIGQREWRRLLKTLAAQVPAVTLVDITESFLANASESFTLAKNISAWSVLVPHKCAECGHITLHSHKIADRAWPPRIVDPVCPTCGGATHNQLAADALAPLQRATTTTTPTSAKLIAQRSEILSRARTDANVAKAGESASLALNAEGAILGKYEIVRPISSGGMAEVLLAKQVGIGGFEKPVALKRIQRQLLETRHLAIDMFLNEAKIAGRLMHPNIVQVLDVGEVGGMLYLAMEYVHGKDLRDLLKRLRAARQNLPLGAACFIAGEVAQALHHAYWSTDMAGQRLNVVHRDVSPHNIILSYEGQVKLLDFGVAMSAVTEQAETMIVGKWQYMSPEHTMSQTLDHRSDLYSLGIVTYLLCSGHMPFSGSTPKEIVRAIRAGEYKSLQERLPEIPPRLAALVARMLRANPDERPQTGREVADELKDIARAHKIESSTGAIATLLGNMFPDESREAGVLELVRSGPDGGDSTKKVAVGSGPTQSQTWADNSKSPSLSAQSQSHSRATPLTPADESVSLARRTSDVPIQAVRLRSTVAPVEEEAPRFAGLARSLIVAAILVIGALVAYLVVRPS